MASKLQVAVKELASRLQGGWIGGRWKSPISARHRARLRKEALRTGQEWPYDTPRKEVVVKQKGHKHDKEAAERRERTKELMEKMPQMLADMKKRRAERAKVAK